MSAFMEPVRASQATGAQRRRLAELLNVVRAGNAFYTAKLRAAGCDGFDALRDSLERLPFTTRTELEQDQRDHPPYGSNLSYPPDRYTRVHQTSGSGGRPLRWLDTIESWEWWKQCWSAVYAAAGVRRGDRILFAFSFGPFIGFWSAFESAVDLGYTCLPAGGMSSAGRLRYLLDHAATIACCTPTYALHLADVARQEGIDLASSAVRLLIVAGEPGGNVPATRARIETEWGARVCDHAGMTEVGAWGYEPHEHRGGLHVNEAEFIAEALDPQTQRPAADGEVGELVLTNLGRAGSPLIRYRTGDLVRLTRCLDPDGVLAARCEGGVLGRTDDMFFIRGNNVFPATIEAVLREIPDVAEFRFHVKQRGSLADLRIEVEPARAAAAADLAERVATAVRERLSFRPEVEIVGPGALPRFEMKARRWVREPGGGAAE